MAERDVPFETKQGADGVVDAAKSDSITLRKFTHQTGEVYHTIADDKGNQLKASSGGHVTFGNANIGAYENREKYLGAFRAPDVSNALARAYNRARDDGILSDEEVKALQKVMHAMGKMRQPEDREHVVTALNQVATDVADIPSQNAPGRADSEPLRPQPRGR